MIERSKSAIRQANYRSRKKATKPAVEAQPVVTPPLSPVVTPEILALARRRRRKNAGVSINPFKLPLHPPSATPTAGTMAMDEGIGGVGQWAVSTIGGAIRDGMAFLGYPLLSEMAQRPEYRKISEIIARHMTRKWIRIKGKGDKDKSDRIGELEESMKDLGVRETFREAAEHDGFFGRGHIYLDFDGAEGAELQMPVGDGWDDVSKQKVKKGSLRRLKTVEPVWAYPLRYNSSDPLSADWYKPKVWYVMGTAIDSSRFLTMVGREVPDLLKPAYSFGGLSLTQMSKPYVDNWLRTQKSVSDTVHSFSVMVLLTNMTEKMNANAEQFFARLDLFDEQRDNTGVLALDKLTEDFKNVSATISELDTLQAQSLEQICSVSSIPVIEFTGNQPAGLNASSDGMIRTFYDWIHSCQEMLYRNPLTAVMGFVMLSLWGEVDDDIEFDFVDLWTIDKEAEANRRKVEADTDALLIDKHIIDPDEARLRIAEDPDTVYPGLEGDTSEDLSEEQKADIATKDAGAIAETFEAQIIDRAGALRALRASISGRWDWISDEDIEEAAAEPPPVAVGQPGQPGQDPSQGDDPAKGSEAPGTDPSMAPAEPQSPSFKRWGGSA